MEVDLKHPRFSSLCDWSSSVPKRSPLPLLSSLCPVTTILPTNDTRFNGKLLRVWKLYQTFQLHPASSRCISANLNIFPSFWKCLPATIVHFQGKGRSKENKKGSFFGFAGLLFAVSRCRPLKWVHERKLSVITDSSHHETLWGLAPECWEGQNSTHQVCNYLAKINTFFTDFHTVFCCADWIIIYWAAQKRDCWVRPIFHTSQVKLKFKFMFAKKSVYWPWCFFFCFFFLCFLFLVPTVTVQ